MRNPDDADSSFSMDAVIFAAGGCVVAGFFISIWLMNWMGMQQRKPQKATIELIRTLGIALEKYADAMGAYPASRDIEDLNKTLVPQFLATPILNAGWGHRFQYRVNNFARASDYYLISAGKDGLFEHDLAEQYERPAIMDEDCIADKLLPCGPSDTSYYENDIVMKDGSFIREPSGKQMTRGGRKPP